MISNRWNQAQADGSYFIDADGDLFKHILIYLRRGTFPIFYTNSDGHDYGLYLALLNEAEYFGLPTLADWIREQKYHEVVKVQRIVEKWDEAALLREFHFAAIPPLPDMMIPRGTEVDIRGTDEDIEINPSWVTTKWLRCSYGKGCRDPVDCGLNCGSRRRPIWMEETTLKAVVVRKVTIVDHEACNHHRWIREVKLWNDIKTSLTYRIRTEEQDCLDAAIKFFFHVSGKYSVLFLLPILHSQSLTRKSLCTAV